MDETPSTRRPSTWNWSTQKMALESRNETTSGRPKSNL